MGRISVLLLPLLISVPTWSYQRSPRSDSKSEEIPFTEQESTEEEYATERAYSTAKHRSILFDYSFLQSVLVCKDETERCGCHFRPKPNCFFPCQRKSVSTWDLNFVRRERVSCTCLLADYTACASARKWCAHGVYSPTQNQCNCDPTYFGDLCNRKCVNGVWRSGECQCLPSYTGRSCDTALERLVMKSKKQSGRPQHSSKMNTMHSSLLVTTVLPQEVTSKKVLGQTNWEVYTDNQTRWWQRQPRNRSHLVQPFLLASGSHSTGLRQPVESGTMAEMYKGLPLLFIVSLVAIVGIILFGALLIIVLVQRKRRPENPYAKLVEGEQV